MAFKKIALAFLPLLILYSFAFQLVQASPPGISVGAWTGTSQSSYQSYYWGYTSAYSSGSSQSTWSESVYTINSAYSGGGDMNGHTIIWNWGDNSESSIYINSGSLCSPSIGITSSCLYDWSTASNSGGFQINGVDYGVGSGEICNYPYTTQGSANGYANTAFSSSDSNCNSGSNLEFAMYHEYSATGIYTVSVSDSNYCGSGCKSSGSTRIAIITPPSVSTPSISTSALDYGSSSGESITSSFNCGSSTICANDYIIDSSSTLYSASNVNSPSSYTATRSSTSATGGYLVAGFIENPITNSYIESSQASFTIFPALSSPTLSVSGTAASVPTSLTISVPIQSAGGSNEFSPQATINWGDSSQTIINSGSSQWSVSGGDYVATIRHSYSSGSYTITANLESANYVNYGSQYGSTSSASQGITISPYVNPAVSTSIPNSNACVSGIWSSKSGSYTFTTTEGSFPTSSMVISWGDGSFSPPISLSGSSQTISESHTYSSGSYTINVNIYDTNGREGSSTPVSLNVNSFQPPQVGGLQPTSATATQQVQFSASVTGGTCPLANINWNWGDGTSNNAGASGGTNYYTHAYQITQGQTTESPAPTLTVQVSDNSGDISTASSPITVSYTYPVIGAITPTTVYASGSQYGADYSNPFSVSLSDGTNQISSISWNWGDNTAPTSNSASTGVNTASHAYSSSGTYPLSVQVTDTSNLYSTATQDISVSPYPMFTVSAISNDSIIYQGVNEIFNITTTQASGGFPLSKITWNWGDNSTPSVFNSPSYGLNSAGHTYVSAGIYTVSVFITDSNGAGTTTSEIITVSAYNPPLLSNFSVSNYTNATTGITAGLPSAYSINLTQGNYTVENMTFEWGDGTPNTFLNSTTSPAIVVNGTDSISHVYGSAGNYTLTIFATDELGHSGTVHLPILVNSYQMPIIQSFSPNASIVNQTQNYNISYLEGSIPLQNLTLDFNGANVTNQISQAGGTRTVPYSMPQAGDVPVTATLCDALANCTQDTYTIYNQILPLITAFFNESYNGYNYNKINTSIVINLTEGSNPIANLTLYFGDGNTQFVNLNNASSVSLVLNNTYSTGTFSPYFVVYDSNGNAETSSNLITPISNYVLGYVTSISPTSVYDVISDSFLFNLTQGSFSMQNITVDWQDGTANTSEAVPANATNITIRHVYPFSTNASYNVIAKACDVNFCTAFGQIINTSYVLPIINSVSPTSAYETVPTNFTFNITQGTFALSTIEVIWGDNSTTLVPINSNSPILNHTYNSTGTYELNAYSSDINGQSSEQFTQIIIVLPYVYPQVSSLSPTSVIAGENVTYNFTATQGTFPISNLSINWGDGQIYTYNNISNGTNSINFLYTENGNFTAIETIYDTRGLTPSQPSSTIIAVSPAPYSFTTPSPIANYTITNQSRPLNLIFSLNYTGNATLSTTFITQQDNLINNYICTQSISPNPSQTSINPANITLSLLCSINPDAISLAPQTLYLTTYAENTAGVFQSITEQININTTISLPQIPTPFNQNETVSTPFPVQPFIPLDLVAIIPIIGILILFILIWFR